MTVLPDGDVPFCEVIRQRTAVFSLDLRVLIVGSAVYAVEHPKTRRLRGPHGARLNDDDCFSYALAQSLGEELLYKSVDLAYTDVARAEVDWK